MSQNPRFKPATVYIQIQSTCATFEEARKIASALVEKRWVACAQIVVNVESIFIWKEELEQTQEVLLLLKTSLEKFEEIKAFIEGHSSYEVPEVICLPILEGSKAYLAWVERSLHKDL